MGVRWWRAPSSNGCPIKHARKIMAAHPYYTGFVDFGNAQSYKDELDNLRTELTKLK